jgi:hypothetical protein
MRDVRMVGYLGLLEKEEEEGGPLHWKSIEEGEVIVDGEGSVICEKVALEGPAPGEGTLPSEGSLPCECLGLDLLEGLRGRGFIDTS